jgi:hypothetical protein
VSGLGFDDLLFQALVWFKAAHEGKSFNMVHCGTAVKDCHKWQELYDSWSNNGRPQSNVVYLEGGTTSATTEALRPRGRNTSKAKAKQEAASQVVVEAIKTFFADKEVSTKKREERKCQDKKEALDSYVDIQTKRVAIEEMNGRARAKEADNKQNELELALLGEEAKIMVTPSPKT